MSRTHCMLCIAKYLRRALRATCIDSTISAMHAVTCIMPLLIRGSASDLRACAARLDAALHREVAALIGSCQKPQCSHSCLEFRNCCQRPAEHHGRQRRRPACALRHCHHGAHT